MLNFSFSIYDTESTNIDQRGAAATPKTADENPELQKLVTHIETLIFQNEVVSAERASTLWALASRYCCAATKATDS